MTFYSRKIRKATYHYYSYCREFAFHDYAISQPKIHLAESPPAVEKSPHRAFNSSAAHEAQQALLPREERLIGYI